jgi:hypothetical protein
VAENSVSVANIIVQNARMAVVDSNSVTHMSSGASEHVREPFEIAALRQFHRNALLVGSPAGMFTVLYALALEPPVVDWRRQSKVACSLSSGTLLVSDVDRFTTDQQERLLEYLNGPCHSAQVISTATTDPFQRVMRGDFLADLYYRLNVVRIDVDLWNVA